MKKFSTDNKIYLMLYVINILILFTLIIYGTTGDTEVAPLTATPMTKEDLSPAAPSPSIPKLISDPILFPEMTYLVYYDINTSAEFVGELTKHINKLSVAISSSNYTIEATEAMLKEKARLSNIKKSVSSDIEHYTTWENEHYYAAKVWEYFMQRGYGEVITSAIIGNMMIEAGGHSLNLQPNVYDPTGRYYGLCQWALKYYPDIKDASFEDQLDHLEKSMPREFKLFGWCFEKDFTYEDFLVMTDPAEAALAFAMVYERCASWGYSPRLRAAKDAYEYFDLEAPIN